MITGAPESIAREHSGEVRRWAFRCDERERHLRRLGCLAGRENKLRRTNPEAGGRAAWEASHSRCAVREANKRLVLGTPKKCAGAGEV